MKEESVKIATMRRLAVAWVANEKELESLWQREGKPRGKAWEKIAKPIWDRQGAVEAKLGTLLLEYAEENNLGQYGQTFLGFTKWSPTRDCYRRIREMLGAQITSIRLLKLIDMGWQEMDRQAWDKKVRSMNDKQWSSYIKNYCAITPEGKATKEFLIELRTAYDAERKRGKR